MPFAGYLGLGGYSDAAKCCCLKASVRPSFISCAPSSPSPSPWAWRLPCLARTRTGTHPTCSVGTLVKPSTWLQRKGGIVARFNLIRKENATQTRHLLKVFFPDQALAGTWLLFPWLPVKLHEVPPAVHDPRAWRAVGVPLFPAIVERDALRAV